MSRLPKFDEKIIHNLLASPCFEVLCKQRYIKSLSEVTGLDIVDYISQSSDKSNTSVIMIKTNGSDWFNHTIVISELKDII